MRLLSVTSLLVLASCGSDGGSSSSAVPITSAPTPTPSPSSSPAPSPSPSAPAYPTFAQLSGNQQFQTACASLNFSSGSPPPANPATGFGDGLLLAYNAQADSYAISNDGVNITFGPADRDPQAPSGANSFVRTDNGFQSRFSFGRPTAGGVALEYARSFSLRTQRASGITQYMCSYGVPTLLSDRPTESNVTFTRTGVGGSAYVAPAFGGLETYSLTASTATVAVNLTTGQITTTIHLLGTLQTASGPAATTTDLGTFTGVGDFDGTRQSYYGQLTSTDRQSVFSFFGGWFFGPQGREALFTLEIVAQNQASNARMSVLASVAAAR